MALVTRASVVPWLGKDTFRRPKRTVARPQADLRQLESVAVRDMGRFAGPSVGQPPVRRRQDRVGSVLRFVMIQLTRARSTRREVFAWSRAGIRRNIRIFLNVHADYRDSLD